MSENNLQDDIQNFAKLVYQAKILIQNKTSVFQINTLIRFAGRDLGLLLNDRAIFGINGQARREADEEHRQEKLIKMSYKIGNT